MSLLHNAPRTWPTARAPTLPRLAIIVTCWVLALAIGPLGMSGWLPLLAGGTAGLIALAALAFRPDWAVLALVATTLFVPVRFATGTQSPIPLSLALTGALAAVWIVRMLVEDKRIHLRRSPVNAPLLTFAVVAALSYVWSSVVRDPLVDNWDAYGRARLGALGTLVLSPAAALLVANHLRTAKHMRVIVGLFIAASVAGLIEATGGIDVPLVNTRGLFPLWVIALSTGQALFNRSLPIRARVVLGMMAAAWLGYQFWQGQTWKSGWVPPLAAIFVLAALRSRRLALILALAAAVFVLANSDYFSNSFRAENQESISTRGAAWSLNWSVTREHWLLGTGPAGYIAYYATYLPNSAMATHNNYLDVLAQTGVIGAAAFAWLLAAAGLSAWRAARHTPRASFEHALAAGLLAGFAGVIVAMMLGDWFLPFAYTQGIAGYDYTVWGWIMIGLIMILARRY